MCRTVSYSPHSQPRQICRWRKDSPSHVDVEARIRWPDKTHQSAWNIESHLKDSWHQRPRKQVQMRRVKARFSLIKRIHHSLGVLLLLSQFQLSHPFSLQLPRAFHWRSLTFKGDWEIVPAAGGYIHLNRMRLTNWTIWLNGYWLGKGLRGVIYHCHRPIQLRTIHSVPPEITWHSSVLRFSRTFSP